ncbi:hypothetical protein J5N97_002247 [Dioscorea zingiberensis]|uniref:N-acetyltransferase domain-containing protein n=1 Tax=Dioscorea zingiberensis TaxID=325984 RepID=A0A9D5D2C4_9LILI|nr:hypothetical protein J5N97_002247 [Dioscorea zingiberensis]
MSSDEQEEPLGVRIRSFDKRKDGSRVEELERMCEVGSTKSPFLFTDTLGDPLCRIRNSPSYKMLVAELGEEMVGIIRGSIKIVSVGNPKPNPNTTPNEGEAKVGYILGLRVSPLFRRRGIGLLLVCKMEEWFMANLVDYAYMATEKKNEASIKLFADKLGYSKFRSSMILVNPVKQHVVHIPSNVVIEKLTLAQAENLYRKFMSSTEFFPKDIDRVLTNKLSLGTWIAHAQGESWNGLEDDRSSSSSSSISTPTSWAMLSVWNCVEVFKLRVGRAPCACVLLAKVSRLISRVLLPCIRVPSMPDLFTPFGFYFMYGIHGEGLLASKLVNSLCHHVHNLAVEREDCKVIVTEIGGSDELRHHIPHWKFLSCSEDLLCMKALMISKNEDIPFTDWTKTPSPPTLFIDPREV